MKAFLAVLLSLLTVTGDVSFTGYPISGQNSGNTGVYAQDVHILHEETAERDAKQEVEEDTASGSEEQEADAGAETNAEADTVEHTGGPQISAPSAILMEASTGSVIYEKDADTARPPASVTKVMTMLLIFDALESGKIKLEDEVTVSEYAASMRGSQVYLEPGETQTVDTMLKCISVASANDACVAFKNGRHDQRNRFF